MKLTLRIKGEIREWSRPLVMGILNLTPDSFYDKSRINSETLANRVDQMIEDGVDIIDIGGMSSRPGALIIESKEEWERIKPALKYISGKHPNAIISVDTFRSEIAQRAISEYGVDIVNDISGGNLDPRMLSVVGENQTVYIGMHMRGTPENMQNHSNYKNLMLELASYFGELNKRCIEHGIADVIIDPGIGFSKTLDQNYEILNNLDMLLSIKLPILVGISRKSLIYKLLNITPEESLPGTIALNTLAILKGASILRVHDVKETVQVVNVVCKTLLSI